MWRATDPNPTVRVMVPYLRVLHCGKCERPPAIPCLDSSKDEQSDSASSAADKKGITKHGHDLVCVENGALQPCDISHSTIS